MEAAGWLRSAACRDEDPELFFPLGFEGEINERQVKQAKAVCSGCPVRSACLSRALYLGEREGIFGGTTPDERRNMRPARVPQIRQEEPPAAEEQLANPA